MIIRHAVIGDIQTNCYLLTDEESGASAAVDCAVFDADYQALLRKAGVTSLKYILLTHGHFDHISGVKQLKDACGGLVCIHHEDAECLTNPKKSLNSYVKYAALETVPPDVFVEEGSELFLGGTKITVIHTPGHTQGSVCYLTDGRMFCGDTLFRQSMGRTDLPGGSTLTLLMSLARIGRMEGEYEIFPGHGETTTLSYEKRNNRYLRMK